jgi:hypothetical protein
MFLLDKNNYSKVIEPLGLVKINKFFARSVVEHKVSGKIYVDNLEHPQTYYVVHPYGMSLLFGDWKNEYFNNQFKDHALNIHHVRNDHEWMQAFPDKWDNIITKLFDGKLVKSVDKIDDTGVIEQNTRVNFKFNKEKYLSQRKPLTKDVEIFKTDEKIYDNMPGSVVPSNFWDTKEDFLKNGLGFSLFYNGQLAATAYSAYIHENNFELGIETVNEYRKKGFGNMVCSAIIDYCLKNNYEPHWGCRLENTASYKLAQSIGFEPIREIPYYRLCK